MNALHQRLCHIFWALLFTLTCASMSVAQGAVTITPPSCDFGNETVPLKSQGCTFIVTNNTASTAHITSFALSGTQFQLIYGSAPFSLLKGKNTFYTVVFAPTQAGPAAETLTVNFSDQPTLTGQVTGNGLITTASAVLSTQTIDFGALEQGQLLSAPVTVTNLGTQAMSLTGVTIDPPFFADPVPVTLLNPGDVYGFNVYFNPVGIGSFPRTLVLLYDSLLPQGIDLAGSGTPASSLAITTFPALVAATKSATYYAQLAQTGGVAPYTWMLSSGSALPSGLSLSDNGVISGAPTATGTYSFAVQVSDSSVPPLVATQTMSVVVSKTPGSMCNNTSWNIPGTSTPIVGLDVLGAGSYLGSQGGLYANGSNFDDPAHESYGISLAQQIQPLDVNGNPDPSGREVLLVLGESNVYLEGINVVQDAMASPGRNPSVLVVNGGQGGATAGKLQDPLSPFWTTITNYLLPNAGATAEQVQAIWFEPTNGISSGTFPTDMNQLHNQIIKVVRNTHTIFPNLKLLYLSSRTYAAYSNGVVSDNPEPYAFESGFPVKWTIQDQISGKALLNYDPTKGPVVAPWIAWGPYYWANGLLVPSLDGTEWSCQDFKFDGNHPVSAGAEKVANEVLKFFKTDSTTTPWFLAH
jgi:hypothetical protein